MNSRFNTAAEKLLSLIKIRKTEKVCIINDGAVPRGVKALVQACSDVGLQWKLAKIHSKRPASSAIPEASKLLKWADIFIAITTNSVTHSPEIVREKKKGKRGISMPRATDEIFLIILKSNGTLVSKINARVEKTMLASSNVRVTSDNGTDFSFKIPGRRVINNNSNFSRKGYFSNVPFGEVYCAPIENSANGVVVIDAWNKLRANANAVLTVKNGKIVKWSKGALPFVKQLARGGKNGFVIAEFGIGTNPLHSKPIGNVLFDEKIYKSVHFAFGSNLSFGGKNKANVHEDAIIVDPKVFFDEKRFKW